MEIIADTVALHVDGEMRAVLPFPLAAQLRQGRFAIELAQEADGTPFLLGMPAAAAPGAVPVAVDCEGRLVFPPGMLDGLGGDDCLILVGRGLYFLIVREPSSPSAGDADGR